ncbi:uncharacterized protein LOC125761835 [Anopheles funestus]|nr:uncharacterized protein LOC125761835 [Anopheles funestus]
MEPILISPRQWAEVTYHERYLVRATHGRRSSTKRCARMKTLLLTVSLFVMTQGAYVVRTFADASRYKDECVKQYAVRGSSLIDYMRQVSLHTDDDDSRWCIVRCILHKSELLEIAQSDTLHEENVHAQMQYSNAIVEDPEDIRSETNRCLQEPIVTGDGCLRAYTFFACIQSTEYDLF